MITDIEGHWFAVPLENVGYAVGIAARVSRRGDFLGYFFGPILQAIPSLDDVKDLAPEQAIHIAHVLGNSILDGEWPIIGRSDAWDRAKWPLPPSLCCSLHWYDDENLNLELFSKRLSEDDIQLLKLNSFDEIFERFLPESFSGDLALVDDMIRLLTDPSLHPQHNYILDLEVTRFLPPPTPNYWEDLTAQQVIVVRIRTPKGGKGYTNFVQALRQVEAELNQCLSLPGGGRYDGGFIGEGWLTLYFHGADADHLFAVIAPWLRRLPAKQGSYAALFRDPTRVEAERIDLSPPESSGRSHSSRKDTTRRKAVAAEQIAPLEPAIFWQHLAAARRGTADDCEMLAEKLTARLARRPKAEIIAFDLRLEELMNQASRWDVWGAAYLINGGCSDDGFAYFRGWLIAQGEEVFTRALADPETLVETIDPGEVAECEGLLIAAPMAYELKTGEPMPPREQHPQEICGEQWTEEELPTLFPRLAQKFLAK